MQSISMPSWIEFWSIFDPNMAPTWPSKSTKIHEKSMPRCHPIMTSFFDRFLIDFCSQLGPPNPENSRPHSCESTIFLKSHFDVHMVFCFDFDPNLAPFYLPKSTKILQKSDPKSHQNLDRFLLRFFLDSGSVLGSKLEPCWPHFPQKWGDAVVRRPPFCWVYVIFWFFGRPGLLLAQFGLDFGTVSYTHLTLPPIYSV